MTSPKAPPRADFLILLSAIVCNCAWIASNSMVAYSADSTAMELARASVTTLELGEHVNYLAGDTLEGREAGSRGGHAAAKYLLDRLRALELKGAAADGTMTQSFNHSMRNVLVEIEGTDPELKQEHIVISAHYDHVGYGNRRNSYGPFGYIHNGADDNASGVSALLELLDALTRINHQPRRTLLFAFWDGEEQGLLGSAHWVRNPTVPLESVKLCINVDMVGRLTDGKIEVGGTRCGAGFRRIMASNKLSQAWLDYSWDYKENSDHWNFFQRSIPALYVHTGIHDDYHRPSDDVEKINFEGIQIVTRYLLEKVTDLGDRQQLPTFRHEARVEKDYRRQQLERPLPQLMSRLSFETVPELGYPGGLRVTRLNGQASSLLPGDIIVAVEGHRPIDEALLQGLALTGDASLQLSVRRKELEEEFQVEVPLAGSATMLGISWREDPAELGTVFVTRVVPYSPAARAGLKLHDRIHAIDDTSFADRHELLTLVQDKLSHEVEAMDFAVESRGVVHHLRVDLTEQAMLHTDPTL